MGKHSILSGLSLALAMGLAVPAARAHPHAWIDLHSALLFDAQGRIAAIEEQWLFDEQYSTFNLQVLAPDQRASKAAVTKLIGEDLARIKPLGYFTSMQADAKSVAPGSVTDYEAELRGKRLWLRFVLPLGAPVDPRARQFSYWIGDPTYWIEMLHGHGEPVALRGKGSDGCRVRIKPPHPTPELLARAAALDVDAKVDPTLGQFFAEKVTVICAGKE